MSGLPPRRLLLLLVPVIFVVVAAVGAMSGAAVAAPGDIDVVVGQYRGTNSLGGAVCLDPGTTAADFNGVPAQSAVLDYNLVGVAATQGGDFFLADLAHGRLHKISGGSITTVAGGGTSTVDGAASAAQLTLRAVAVGPGDEPYFADIDVAANTIRIRRLVGTAVATVQSLTVPNPFGDFGLAVDAAGNMFLVGGGFAGRVPAGGGLVTTFAGVTGGAAAVDADGTTLYAVDHGSYAGADGRLFKVDVATGVATTLRSDLNQPTAVAVDLARGPAVPRLFVSEGGGATVSELDPSNGHPSQPVAGTGVPIQNGQGTGDGGPGVNAGLAATIRFAVDGQDDVFILDADNCVVRMVEKMPAVNNSPPSTVAPTTPSTIPATANRVPVNQVVPPGGAPAGSPAPLASGAQTVGTPVGATGGSFTPGAAANPVGVSGAPGGIGLGGSQSAPALGPLGAPTPVVPGAAPLGAVPSAFVLGISPGPALVLGADGVAAAQAAAASRAAPEPEAVKGAVRYTMVANDRGRGQSPFLPLTALGVMGLFGCVVAVALHAEGGESRRVMSSAWRPRW